MSGYQLSLQFLTDDPMFARGFECGVLYEKMMRGDTIETHIHATNDEQVLLMARRLNYTCEMSPAGNGWMVLELSPSSPPLGAAE